MLKTIYTHYGFFFQIIISSDEIEVTPDETKELQALIDERDYFSIKELIHKSRS